MTHCALFVPHDIIPIIVRDISLIVFREISAIIARYVLLCSAPFVFGRFNSAIVEVVHKSIFVFIVFTLVQDENVPKTDISMQHPGFFPCLLVTYITVYVSHARI